MPNALKAHRLTTLKPRLTELDPLKARGIKMLGQHGRTVKQKRMANGRTLSLNSAAWRKLRALVITEQPLCAHCELRGLSVPGNEVDHIDNDPTNNERSNLVNLCRPCHSQKTNRHEYFKRTGRRLPVKGCDANGNPFDPDHPWNTAK